MYQQPGFFQDAAADDPPPREEIPAAALIVNQIFAALLAAVGNTGLVWVYFICLAKKKKKTERFLSFLAVHKTHEKYELNNTGC